MHLKRTGSQQHIHKLAHRARRGNAAKRTELDMRAAVPCVTDRPEAGARNVPVRLATPPVAPQILRKQHLP
jgi:hypothetical protein